MSKTQQEIATPKSCNQRKSPNISGIIALIFISLIALGIVALGCMLLTGNDVITISVLMLLSVIFAVVAIIFLRENRLAVKIILDVLTGEIALILIAWFIANPDSKKPVNSYIYIATTAVMAIVLICLNIVKLYDKPNDNKLTTRYITYTATFVALSVIFKMLGNAVSTLIPSMKLSFVYIPWVLSGIVLGPVGGVITAVIGDALGQLTIATGGAWHPLTMLSNALFPLASALIFKFVKKGPNWLKLSISMLISLIVCTLGIGAYALYIQQFQGMDYMTFMITWRLPQVIVVAINFILCLLLLPVIDKMRLREKVRN